jgi:hypothetical protein
LIAPYLLLLGFFLKYMRFRIKIILFGSLLLLGSFDVLSQNDFFPSSRFTADLLRDSFVLNPNDFVFNSLTLINYTNENLYLGVKIELPKGFELLSPLRSYIHINPG